MRIENETDYLLISQIERMGIRMEGEELKEEEREMKKKKK
jgi:allophanate hydrolase subunit 2